MTARQAASPFEAEDEACPRCLKRRPLCVCADIVPIDNRVGVLVLQHPQEQDKDLGTARLTTLQLRHAVFRIGLSWPSLAKALGRPADPKRWAILYLGSARTETFPPNADVVVLDKKGGAVPDQTGALSSIEGIVVLDGTWAQAKTLWWRNAWMLKSRRIALSPKRPSLYGKLRREPRREALSTLEAVGLLLARLEGRPEIEMTLRQSFAKLLDRYRGEGSRGKPTDVLERDV